MAYGLLQEQGYQPTYQDDSFGAPAGPVNNPFLRGYADDYAAREAAFQEPQGNSFNRYTWGTPPPPALVEQPRQIPELSNPVTPRRTGLEGGLEGNNDVFSPRGSNTPSTGPNFSMPDGVNFGVNNPFSGVNFGDNPFSGVDLGFTGVLDGLSDIPGTVESYFTGVEPGYMGNVGVGARQGGNIMGIGSMGVATGFAVPEAMFGLAELSAINNELSSLGMPTIGIMDAIAIGFDPRESLTDRGNALAAPAYDLENKGKNYSQQFSTETAATDTRGSHYGAPGTLGAVGPTATNTGAIGPTNQNLPSSPQGPLGPLAAPQQSLSPGQTASLASMGLLGPVAANLNNSIYSAPTGASSAPGVGLGQGQQDAHSAGIASMAANAAAQGMVGYTGTASDVASYNAGVDAHSGGGAGAGAGSGAGSPGGAGEYGGNPGGGADW